jgi:hypothetical protein
MGDGEGNRRMRQPLRKRMLTAAQFVARFKAEKVLQQLRFCELFAMWRKCPIKRCRRDQTCRSDQPFCMVLAHLRVPRRAQIQARQDILDAMPENLGAPERAARECMPFHLFMVDTSGAAATKYREQRQQARIFDHAKPYESSRSQIPSARR